jgi:hypothetical protein
LKELSRCQNRALKPVVTTRVRARLGAGRLPQL